MKKIYILLLVALVIPTIVLGLDNCCCDACYLENQLCDHENYKISRTFMMTRPVSQNLAMDESVWHDFIYSRYGTWLSSFQVTAVYQQSIPQKETPEYFTFNCGNCLFVLGDDAPDVKHRNIRAEWLGLPKQFRGYMSICPKQKQMGAIIEFNQSFENFFEFDFLKRYYLSVSIPIIAVENNMNFSQFDIFNPGPTTDPHARAASNWLPKDLRDAFNNPNWNYARINGQYSKVRAAPIKIKFGGAFLDDENNQVASFTSILLPTDGKSEGKYLFEPLVGYNSHLGIGTGVNFQFVLNKNRENFDLCFFLNLEAIFLIRNMQKRTFDLKGKPWSRYLLFNHADGHINDVYSGVNVLTQYVKVRPYNIVDLSMGLRFKTEHAELEIGYNIWGHGEERIECIQKFSKCWGIAGQPQEGDTKPRSASLSTICSQEATAAEKIEDQTSSEFKFIPIDECDLDKDSATSQSALNHRVHVAFGYEGWGERVTGFVGIGGYYEMPQKNSALKTYGFWFKLGGSF